MNGASDYKQTAENDEENLTWSKKRFLLSQVGCESDNDSNCAQNNDHSAKQDCSGVAQFRWSINEVLCAQLFYRFDLAKTVRGIEARQITIITKRIIDSVTSVFLVDKKE